MALHLPVDILLVDIGVSLGDGVADLLVDIGVSLNDGVTPGLIPLNRSVDHAHAKANIEHVAMASTRRADGLQDPRLQALRNKTSKPQPAAAVY